MRAEKEEKLNEERKNKEEKRPERGMEWEEEMFCH